MTEEEKVNVSLDEEMAAITKTPRAWAGKDGVSGYFPVYEEGEER